MKFLHTSDWHVGRTLNGWSLLEEQEWAFEQIVKLAITEKVDGVIIAGDLYDRAIPPTNAIKLFNKILYQLVLEHGIPVYAISGNHDGAERIRFGREFFEPLGLHLATRLEEAFMPIELEDTQIFLLPFIDPIDARIYYKNDEEKDIQGISDALKYIIEDIKAHFNPKKAHVLVTHFAVSKKEDQEGQELHKQMLSETSNKVGGLNTISSNMFKDFDYVALGHIHTRFASPSEYIKYSGSPVTFNVKEAKRNENKGVYVVEVKPTGQINQTFHALEVKKPIMVLKESFETLISKDYYKNQPCHEAWFAFEIHISNRKELEGVNIRARLEEIYGQDIVEIYFTTLTNNDSVKGELNKGSENLELLSPEEIVSEFYQTATGGLSLSHEQSKIIEEIFENIERSKQ